MPEAVVSEMRKAETPACGRDASLCTIDLGEPGCGFGTSLIAEAGQQAAKGVKAPGIGRGAGSAGPLGLPIWISVRPAPLDGFGKLRAFGKTPALQDSLHLEPQPTPSPIFGVDPQSLV